MSIEIRSVSKHFGDFAAVDDVSLQVPSGSLTALLGPSGSGKSTLLRIVAGLESPDAGQIVISGKDATCLSPQKRGVGFVFQHYAAFKHMSVHDNIAFGLKVRRRPKAQIRERVDELLHLVQLEGLGTRYPSQLSGGQRQRMGLARALAPEPEVLLLDEPFGALDARVRAELREWLTRLHDVVHVTTVVRDSRSGGGDGGRRPDRSHEQRQARARSGRRGSSTTGPANDFVMRFVGDANEVGGVLVRPHDVELLPEASEWRNRGDDRPRDDARPRCKVELHDSTGVELVAVLTRDRFEELELWRGQTVGGPAEDAASEVGRRVWRSTRCAAGRAGSSQGRDLSRPNTPEYWGSLRPCLAAPSAPPAARRILAGR